MILTASSPYTLPLTQPHAHTQPAHTRPSSSHVNNRNYPHIQHSHRSSSTSSSLPSDIPSDLFDHDMTSPSTSVPFEEAYGEGEGGGLQEEERGEGRMDGGGIGIGIGIGGPREKLSVDMRGLLGPTSGDGEGEGEEDSPDAARHLQPTPTTTSPSTARRPPVSPVRLAKLANAFGVPTPVPPSHDPSPALAHFGFASPPAHPYAHTHARSTATRFLLHVVPPAHLAAELDPAAAAQLRRGALVPLHTTLRGQLGAVACEYRLPSTSGMVLYLVPDDLPNSAADSASDLPDPMDALAPAAGPRISDDAWKLLWQPVLRMERDDLASASASNHAHAALASPRSASASASASVLSHSPVPSPPRTLHDSPVDDAEQSPSRDARALRPLNTGTVPSPHRRAFAFPKPAAASAPPPTSAPAPAPARSRQSSLASLTSTSSHPSRPSPTHASRPSTSTSTSMRLPGLAPPPIVGKVEFDIERHKAGWYDVWLERTRRPGGAGRALQQGQGQYGKTPSPGPVPLQLQLQLQLSSRATSQAGFNSQAGSRIGSRTTSRAGSAAGSRSPRSPLTAGFDAALPPSPGVGVGVGVGPAGAGWGVRTRGGMLAPGSGRAAGVRDLDLRDVGVGVADVRAAVLGQREREAARRMEAVEMEMEMERVGGREVDGEGEYVALSDDPDEEGVGVGMGAFPEQAGAGSLVGAEPEDEEEEEEGRDEPLEPIANSTRASVQLRRAHGHGAGEGGESSPDSEYEDGVGDGLEHEDDGDGGEDTLPTVHVPALSLNSDPLGDVFPTDGETWSALRHSVPAHAPDASPRSSVSSLNSNSNSASASASAQIQIQGLGIRMNGVPYSPEVERAEHSHEHSEPDDAVFDPPSPGRFDDEEGTGSGTEWGSADDVEDVVGLWNEKHSTLERITQADLRDSLRQAVTLVEVSRPDKTRESAAPALERDEHAAPEQGRASPSVHALSPEPVYSPSTITPRGSPPGSSSHSRIASSATATDASPSLPPSLPDPIQVNSASPSPPAPLGRRLAATAIPPRLAPSPIITERLLHTDGSVERERDSALSLAYLSSRGYQKPQRNSSLESDGDTDSLRASQMKMQRELDDIEKAYAQISPRENSTASFMDLNNSPDLAGMTPVPVFPNGAKPANFLLSNWPSVPVSPTVAQQGLAPLLAPGFMQAEDRPFAPQTVSVETLKRARSAEEDGAIIPAKDRNSRRVTKSPSIYVGHERNESVRSRDSSRFSEESATQGVDGKRDRKRTQSVMSVKSIRRLWKKGAQGALQDVQEDESPPLPTPGRVVPPSPRRGNNAASPRASTSSSVDSNSDSRNSKRDSGLDHFRFDQDARLAVRSPTPSSMLSPRLPPVPPPPQNLPDRQGAIKAARTRSVLRTWTSPKLRQQQGKPEPESEQEVKINGRAVTISAPMHVIHGQADLRDARFASVHRAAPSPPQSASVHSNSNFSPPLPPPKDDSAPSAALVRKDSSPPTRPARQNSVRRKPVPGLDQVGEDGVRITHSPASSLSRTHRAGPSISASLLSQPVQEERERAPRPSMSSSTDDPLSPSELSAFEMVTPVGYAHIRSSPAF